MMKRILFIALLSLSSFATSAKEVRDTLYTSNRDRFILTYDISQQEDAVSIRFKGFTKELGEGSIRQFKDPERLDIVFFDRTRAFDGVSFTSMEPLSFSTPTSLRYGYESKGYFFIKESPEIVFTRRSVEDCELEIPLFLSYYERRGRYRLVDAFNDLTISLVVKKPVKKIVESTTVVTTEETIQVAVDETDELELLCLAIRNNLERQKELPFDDILSSHIDELGKMERQRISAKDQKLINRTLDQIENKRQQLKDIAKEREDEVRRQQERKERLIAQQMKAEQDSLRVAEQKKEEEREKRNIWMIIGGGILAVLGFGGNQVIQHVRNSNNQKSMMEMQQNIVNQAKGDAKRRVQSYTANKTRQATNKIRTAGREAARTQVEKVKTSISKVAKPNRNNKKNFSI